MNHKEFFDKHADDVIYTTTFHAGQTTRLETIGRVEYLYQMFKARMMDELCHTSGQACKTPTTNNPKSGIWRFGTV